MTLTPEQAEAANGLIHNILGKCWHQGDISSDVVVNDDFELLCIHCGKAAECNPDYIHDLNAALNALNDFAEKEHAFWVVGTGDFGYYANLVMDDADECCTADTIAVAACMVMAFYSNRDDAWRKIMGESK